MAWIERALRAFDQKNEQEQRLNAIKEKEKEKEKEKAWKKGRERIAKDLAGRIKSVTGEKVRVDPDYIVKVPNIVKIPIDRESYIYGDVSEDGVYGVVNLDSVEFGIHYYTITTGNNYYTYTHHTDLVVLQRDERTGLLSYSPVHTAADLGRVLQHLRTSSLSLKEGSGLISVTGGPGSISREEAKERRRFHARS